MRRLVVLLVAVASLGFAAQAGAATWPAHCHTFRCVNKHMNALHKTAKAQGAILQDLLTNSPPGNAVLQGEIDQLQNVDNGQFNAINNIQNQPALNGCWQDLAFARFHTDGTPYTSFGQGGSFPSYGPSFDGYFDLRHTGEPDNTYLYRLVWDSCNSG